MTKIIFLLVNLIFYIFLIFQKKISAGQKIKANLLGFHSQILLNDFDFLQFSIPPRHVRGCGKFPNLSIFAPFGLWKSRTKKVPCPVHKNQKQCVLVFGCFVVVFVVVFVFFCRIWSNIIIFSPPEHRKHHLNLKWGGSIF